ncbi:hypothetical protein L1987_74407 [Smallanthus sonchifolius]|uniref:Uncharacterized protein n=1 Tax=Smallanthus sonchifolius TaxID=185202 RepID=A0ACB9A239_9ASTR|nr:hypothetical protein L1987_74407 [Smallanthus sonchifolius]
MSYNYSTLCVNKLADQVKNPWPNVDAHNGVLLNIYDLTEARYAKLITARLLHFCLSDVYRNGSTISISFTPKHAHVKKSTGMHVGDDHG